MVIKEKNFVCRDCGKAFSLKAKKAFYCPVCAKKAQSRRTMLSRAKKDPGIKIGVGSGGNQLGENNHMFKDGLSHYRKNYFETIGAETCSVCGSTKHIVVHHIDGNRKNNALKNLTHMCRACHAREHNLIANLIPSRA